MEGFTGNESSDKPIPLIEDVFKKLTNEQIFSYYIPGIVFGDVMSSPLGDVDNKPSLSIFWSQRYSKYMFKEHRYGWFGDSINFVQRLYGYETIVEACMKILLDFGITDYHIYDNLSPNPIDPATRTGARYRPIGAVKIQVTIRDWNQDDIAFWGQYGITIQWLMYAKIIPIKYYYINGHIKIADKLSYAYVETKDGKVTYKIYQPYAEHEKKWISNNNSSVWELWNMLPDTHDILIITKSRKDALAVMATMNIPSTSLQAEGVIPKVTVMKELKLRFRYIFFLYDNDFDKEENYGRIYGKKLSDLFDIPQIELPEIYQQKDYSDSVKAHGIGKASSILWRVIKQAIIKITLER